MIREGRSALRDGDDENRRWYKRGHSRYMELFSLLSLAVFDANSGLSSVG